MKKNRQSGKLNKNLTEMPKQSEKGPNLKKNPTNSPEKSQNAFEILMDAAKLYEKMDVHGSPDFSRIKRSSDQLSSPSSPPTESNIKKSKAGSQQKNRQK